MRLESQLGLQQKCLIEKKKPPTKQLEYQKMFFSVLLIFRRAFLRIAGLKAELQLRLTTPVWEEQLDW